MNARRLALSLVSAFAALVPTVRGQTPTTLPTVAPPADATLSVFLLVGQSNMAGRGKVEAEDLVADAHVWKLDASDAWVPAVDPLHFDKPIAGVGLGRTFGALVAAREPGTHVGLVPCAVGGTSISQWSPGGKLYVAAMRRAKVALAHGTLRGILWHQGESDAKPASIDAYPAKLEALLASMRKELGAPDAPVVIGQIGPFLAEKQPDVPAFNAMLVRFAAEHPHVACATSEGLAHLGDKTHFDAKSQRELGRRYAAAYYTLLDAAAAK